jgi:hypothetical protein
VVHLEYKGSLAHQKRLCTISLEQSVLWHLSCDLLAVVMFIHKHWISYAFISNFSKVSYLVISVARLVAILSGPVIFIVLI